MAEKSYLIDKSGGVWERTGAGLRSIAVCGTAHRGPLLSLDRLKEIDGRYGPLESVDPADPRIPR